MVVYHAKKKKKKMGKKGKIIFHLQEIQLKKTTGNESIL